MKYGSQNTDGSCSVRDFYESMRAAGAAARTTLEHAAAGQRGVPEGEVQGQKHLVVHATSNRRMPYSQLVPLVSSATAPNQNEVRFKTLAQFRYIGKDMQMDTLDDIVVGKGTFGSDAKMPGMVYAAVERPPVMGSALQGLDDAAVKQVKGVQQVVKLDIAQPPLGFKPLGGAAAIADSTWAALQGRRRLKANWDLGPNASYESGAYKAPWMPRRRSPDVWHARSATSTRSVRKAAR